jgi:hypothetical protein
MKSSAAARARLFHVKLGPGRDKNKDFARRHAGPVAQKIAV